VTRVLVADANGDWRFLVTAALAGSDLLVVGEAEDAASAIRLAGSLAPDLVLVDPSTLPGATAALPSQLRAGVPRETAIVLASARPRDDVWLGPDELGCAFLPKATPASTFAAVLAAHVVARCERMALPADVARCSFDAEPSSVPAARRFAREVLSSRHCPEAAVEAVLLVLSELVTNAVIHARTEVEVVVVRRPGVVRVEVVDRAREHVRRRDAADDEQGGRGMALIDALTEAWGVEDRPAGKAVWFEVQLGEGEGEGDA